MRRHYTYPGAWPVTMKVSFADLCGHGIYTDGAVALLYERVRYENGRSIQKKRKEEEKEKEGAGMSHQTLSLLLRESVPTAGCPLLASTLLYSTLRAYRFLFLFLSFPFLSSPFIRSRLLHDEGKAGFRHCTGGGRSLRTRSLGKSIETARVFGNLFPYCPPEDTGVQVAVCMHLVRHVCSQWGKGRFDGNHVVLHQHGQTNGKPCVVKGR